MFKSPKARRRRVRELAEAEAGLLQMLLAQDGVKWEPLELYVGEGGYMSDTPAIDGRELATDLAIGHGQEIDSPVVAGLVAAQLFANSATTLRQFREGNTDLVAADATYSVRVFESYLRVERKRPDLAAGVQQGIARLISKMKEGDEES